MITSRSREIEHLPMDPERERLAMLPDPRGKGRDLVVFPEKHCQRCGRKFERKVTGKKRTMETLERYMERKYCGAACHYEARREELERRETA